MLDQHSFIDRCWAARSNIYLMFSHPIFPLTSLLLRSPYQENLPAFVPSSTNKLSCMLLYPLHLSFSLTYSENTGVFVSELARHLVLLILNSSFSFSTPPRFSTWSLAKLPNESYALSYSENTGVFVSELTRILVVTSALRVITAHTSTKIFARLMVQDSQAV